MNKPKITRPNLDLIRRASALETAIKNDLLKLAGPAISIYTLAFDELEIILSELERRAAAKEASHA